MKLSFLHFKKILLKWAFYTSLQSILLLIGGEDEYPLEVLVQMKERSLFSLYLMLRRAHEAKKATSSESIVFERVEKVMRERPYEQRLEFYQGPNCSDFFRELYWITFLDLEKDPKKVRDYESSR